MKYLQPRLSHHAIPSWNQETHHKSHWLSTGTLGLSTQLGAIAHDKTETHRASVEQSNDGSNANSWHLPDGLETGARMARNRQLVPHLTTSCERLIPAGVDLAGFSVDVLMMSCCSVSLGLGFLPEFVLR
jgi:hypothetical protein